MLESGGVKIWRPLQVYVGEGKRDYVDISERKEGKPSLGSEPTEVSACLERSYQPNQADLALVGTPHLLKARLPRRVR